MSTIKTTVSNKLLNQIISKLDFSKEPIVTPIKSGELSMAFELKLENYSLILRINKHSDKGFWKDKFAYDNFTKFGLKIPKIIQNGEEENYFYSLSEKCIGQALDTLGIEEGKIMQEDLFRQLDILYSIPPMKEGFGTWDKNLKGRFDSKQDHIIYNLGTRKNDDFNKPFIDLDLHKRLHDKSLTYGKYIPSKRWLIHGDAGFNNAYGYNGHISGLFDWAESGYQDFLFDIAWLMFWNNNAIQTDTHFSKFAKQNPQKYDLENFTQRINCYLLQIAFGSLNFFARSNQEDSYKDTIGIIQYFRLL